MDPIDARGAALARIAESEADVAALREHLGEIIEGTAFKGSPRSARFLTYIVNKAIEGHLEALKERVIGAELFKRSRSYDTGEDAIVRVTASDVRRRLLLHYGRNSSGSAFRIGLPLGSYVPEITREVHENGKPPDQSPPAHVSNRSNQSTNPTVRPLGTPGADSSLQRSARRTLIIFLSLSSAMFMIGVGLTVIITLGNRSSQVEKAAKLILPWSAFFRSQDSLEVITSDPNIAEIQGFTGGQITASDYANHHYLVGPNKLSPEAEHICRDILRGDKSSTIDSQIAAAVGEIAGANSRPIGVYGARDVRMSDLKTNNNFIFIGSPRSNPWVSLFSDQLDFRFVLDPRAQTEYIVNVRPQPNENAKYVPTALGWTTGDSFAIIAFVRNPDQDGRVLLLAGANAEGTKAAGKLATDLPRLSGVLQRCGIRPSGPQEQFEVLLHLNMMAGSPSNTEVVACHILAANALQRP